MRMLAQYDSVYFVLRHDHQLKPGGDVDLARYLARQAEIEDVRVKVLTAAELQSAGPEDALVLFNIDRPYDAVTALGKAHPATACYLYTLHHPSDGVKTYLRHGVSGVRRMIAVLVDNDPMRYEAVVDFAKGIRLFNINRISFAISRSRHVQTLLARSHLFVVSHDESSAIALRFSNELLKVSLLPHPIEPYHPVRPSATRPYILVPGRIEPRKNQLAALRTLSSLRSHFSDHDIIVVGGAGANAQYFQNVIDFCESNQITYQSQLDKSAFFSLVSRASVVANASYFEVTSLIDLYAIKNRIPLLTTKFGYYVQSPLVRLVNPVAWSTDKQTILESLRTLIPASASQDLPPEA